MASTSKLLLLSIFLVQFSMSCGNKTTSTPKEETKKDSVSTEKVENSEGLSYEGTLPCQDCDGIKTTLEMSADNQSCGVIESYLSPSDDIEIHKYSMNTERGYESDDDATVYILNWDKEESTQRYFVRETRNEDSIFEIDSNRKKFNDGKNHILTKKVD